MRSGTRGVSTVVDVALCLVLVSAAVVTLGALLNADERSQEPDTAAQTAELLGATTLSVEYSTRQLAHADEFDDGPIDTQRAYDRTEYGPAAGLLASAAIANAEVDGTHLNRAGPEYESAVEGGLLDALTETDENVYVTAVWQPYDGSSIRGVATAGREPPADADVSSATLTVPTAHREPQEDELRAAYDRDYDALSTAVAESIIAGWFPPERTQLALERQGVERQTVEYRYERLVTALDSVDPYDVQTEISRSGADAQAVNENLARALADDVVAEDLSTTLEAELEASEESELSESEQVTRATSTVLSNGEVSIVVRTWNE